MKAPDKIFKHLTTGNRLLDGRYYEYKPAKIRYDDEIIEYIRKEALLEYVKDRLAQYDPEYTNAGKELQMIIDKINSL